LSCKRAGL